jgi:hypothetical protein
MEGQPAVVSCQVNAANLPVKWFRDQQNVLESDRVAIQSDLLGFHQILIKNVQLEDQGTYVARLNDQTVSITLVVEGLFCFCSEFLPVFTYPRFVGQSYAVPCLLRTPK